MPTNSVSPVRLRLPQITENDPSWMSRGIMQLGQGLVQAVRNPRTHQLAEPEEQIALEELAALSMFARFVDAAEVQMFSSGAEH